MFLNLLLLSTLKIVATNDFGLIPFCPGAEKPLHISEGILVKEFFFTAQIHYPTFTYRKRYFYGRAVKSIGTDPNIDFKNRKTMLFFDGYMDSTHYPLVRAAVGQYAARGYNTFSIDAMRLYSFIFPVAARVAIQVGNATGLILSKLLKYGLRPEDVEMVGLSLGGQTMAFAAKFFQLYSGKKIGRIVSMDPSGPCYRNWGPESRLTPSDADFVQVIHTNSEGLGMGKAMGHVDFYLNGGEYQLLIDPYQPWCDEFPSHAMSMAIYYSAMVMYPDKYIGVKCKTVQQAREHKCFENTPVETNVVGPKADPKKPGIYYVPILPNAPFFAPDDFMEKKPNYPRLYHDSLSHIENMVLG